MSPQASEKRTILVVEDETPVRTLTMHCLRKAGYEVLEAGSPLAAHGVIGSDLFRIDVLFTDINLPGQNGKELAAVLVHIRPA
jgi:two-component system cell cycle sensor histidine kinase/response regulator CckA